MTLDTEKLSVIADEVRKAGAFAFQRQADVRRTFKKDGSVLTDVDMAISHSLVSKIRTLFPGAAIVSEEEETGTERDAEWTFILDPIDGTDVYSQGLPSFAVSLGVLDSNREPVGAYIAAPRFGIGTEEMFVRMDPGKTPLLNGKEIKIQGDKDTVNEVTTGSKAFKYFDFSSFTGKFRIFGSTIIHMLSPVVFSSIEASLTFSCYAWDIASSHAVLKSVGMDSVYADLEPLVYDDDFLYRKHPLRAPLYSGSEKGREALIKMLPPL